MALFPMNIGSGGGTTQPYALCAFAYTGGTTRATVVLLEENGTLYQNNSASGSTSITGSDITISYVQATDPYPTSISSAVGYYNVCDTQGTILGTVAPSQPYSKNNRYALVYLVKTA